MEVNNAYPSVKNVPFPFLHIHHLSCCKMMLATLKILIHIWPIRKIKKYLTHLIFFNLLLYIVINTYVYTYTGMVCFMYEKLSISWSISARFCSINYFKGDGWSMFEGGPKKTEFIYKKLCIYSYIFKLQSPSKYSPFDAIHLSKCFFHCSKRLLNSDFDIF